jgi:hypothetical protein
VGQRRLHEPAPFWLEPLAELAEMSIRSNWAGRAVRASSTLAGAVGLAALIFDLLAPSYAWRSNGSLGQLSGSSNLVAVGMEPVAVLFVLLAAMLCALVALSGWAVAKDPSSFFFVVLMFSAGGLVVASLLGGWYIGPSLLPAACLGLVAAGTSIALYLGWQRPAGPKSG